MRKGQSKQIVVRGEKLEATYLGKGMFSTAYLVGDSVYVFSKNDPTKEALSRAVGLHVPELSRVDYTEDIAVYKMPYYAPLTPANKPAWSIFRAIQKILDESIAEISKKGRLIHNFWHHYGNDVLVEVANRTAVSDLPDDIKDSISSICAWGCNFGSSVMMEISKTNLGVDQNGNIIFRDVLFDSSRIR